MTNRAHVLSGLDNLNSVDALLKSKRVGLMTNQTGISHRLHSAVDIIHNDYKLTALFACEHGVRGSEQAGAEFDSYVDAETGVPVFSTYAAPDHRLTGEMLEAFDVFVFDMQDVGARFFTYLYSLSYAMESCAGAGKPMVVLDRINPIGGEKCEGTILDPAFRSFVGDYELPTRTGLTIGEYARYVKDYLKLDLDLTVVPIQGWKRSMYLDDTDLPWVAPSPNCASFAAAMVYSGTCIFEGTNVSEGRGTTQPFELIGAPWIDSRELERRMNAFNLPGVWFRRAAFSPMFSKHTGKLCHGVQVHILDRDRANICHAGLKLMETIRLLHPQEFQYTNYRERFTVDSLLGTDKIRTNALTADEAAEAFAPQLSAFQEMSRPYRLY
ncbi:hypothetical protein AGMMS49992_01010 [Clostridia bacterium]|nr:hypothetical protein AGMMS49992_01010 [Clostridia bacterium]